VPKKATSYEDDLLHSLRDPAQAEAYLRAHLDETGPDADALFLLALRDVAKAHGMGRVAAKARVGRESLYKSLAEDGNPKWGTLVAVLRALGLGLSVARSGRRPALAKAKPTAPSAAQTRVVTPMVAPSITDSTAVYAGYVSMSETPLLRVTTVIETPARPTRSQVTLYAAAYATVAAAS